MINAKLVTCGLCQNYYADPRQIPCSHPFCFDCILGRFDDQTFSLVCPKCGVKHQYHSYEEFEHRCMPDGFLASMVAQFKKNQSRLSAVSSRPSSITPLSTHDPSSSERSTPSQRSASFVTPSNQQSSSIIAKCQLCNHRRELIICQHCENVICMDCVDEHQRIINSDVKSQWERCKNRFENLNDQSIRYDQIEEEISTKARQLQTHINQLNDHLIKTLENQKKDYLDLIDKHRQTTKPFALHEQVVDEYESIDKRLEELDKSNDITTDQINDFLFEIEHLEGRLDNLNQIFDTNSIQFPILTRPEPIDGSSLFGTLDFVDFNSSPTLNGHIDLPQKSDSNNNDILVDRLTKSESISSSSSSSIPTMRQKKLLWQIDYFSVPYYVRTYDNHLYICDKYGSLAIYKLNSSSKPTLIDEIKLFKDNYTTSNDDDQTFIDSFAVYKLWIIVFKRKKNELHGTIYLFSHNGKLFPNGKYVHNHPSRELTIDTERDILWSLDQKLLTLFYCDLPDKKSNNLEEYFRNRRSHVQFPKPFAPIHISVNKTGIAVLDKYRQAVHVYDKKTREKIDEHTNTYYHSTHVCWDMALFSNNSLLIKLDETSTLKSGPSKHIYLQLDTTSEHHIIGQIEEIDAYGMMITPNDEILIGIRINTKGIIKCYV